MRRLHHLALLGLLTFTACGKAVVDFPNLPPTVTSTDPADGAVNVPAAQTISAVFSAPMAASTITSTTFTVSQAGSPVAGAVSYSSTNALATFTPAAALLAGTIYTGRVTTGAKDTTGNALAADHVWTFTTFAAAPGNTAPTVTSTVPANAATGVAINSKVSAIFSAAMDATTLSATSFIVSQGATHITGTVVATGSTATFTPAANLTANTVYGATIKAGVKDASGNALAADYNWSFTTSATVDTTPPTVLSTVPANNATGVPAGQKISATFSEAMDPATLTGTSFTVKQGAASVAGALSYSAATNTATFSPTSNLAGGATFTATVTTGAKDVAGNALAANYVWTFSTNGPPQVTSTNPIDGSANLCIPFGIDATFDKELDPLTVIPANFTLTSPGPTPVQGSTSLDSQTDTATFAPSNALLANTTYTATLTTGIKDVAGDALAADKVWTFTTNANPCILPVNLRSLSTFVAVAGAGLTNSNSGGVTVLNGDVGLSPTATCMGDGSPCSALDPTIHGTLYANDPAGKAAAAKADLVSAYNDAAGRPPGIVEADLSGLVLAPGIYTSNSTMIMATNASLTLDGQGDPNAVWIFQIGSSLTIGTGAQVLLINGAKAANVFWAAAASSTLNGGVHFNGTVLAQASNSVGLSSVVNGRLLCTTGQITLLANTINLP